MGGLPKGIEVQGREGKRGKNWDKYNSIIKKYNNNFLKNLIVLGEITYILNCQGFCLIPIIRHLTAELRFCLT